MKKYTLIFCKAIVGLIIAVIVFIAGGFWESLKHPEIVKEQSITMKELKAELVKRQPFSLQTGDDFDLSFTPDSDHAACVVFKRRHISRNASDLQIAGAGDEGYRRVTEGK